ncbi:MAG: hypothetical protein ACRDRG_04755 [Pseudonocardiaceae bacterium]
MRLGVGNGGWLRVDDPDELPGPLFVKLRPDSDGRWRTTELYLDGRGETLSGDLMRRLRLDRIEALAADPEVRSSLASRAGDPEVPLSVLASHYATTFGTRARNWVVDALRSQLKDSGVGRVKRAKDPDHPTSEVRPPLRAPEGGRLTDDFLRQVYGAYKAAIRRGEWPAPALAEQTGVTPHAVRKWIYTARRRGIIPQGKQGVVS